MGRHRTRGDDAEVFSARISASLVHCVTEYTGLEFGDFVNQGYEKEKSRMESDRGETLNQMAFITHELITLNSQGLRIDDIEKSRGALETKYGKIFYPGVWCAIMEKFG
jgi:hypothetical protein